MLKLGRAFRMLSDPHGAKWELFRNYDIKDEYATKHCNLAND